MANNYVALKRQLMRKTFPPIQYQYDHMVKCLDYEGLLLNSYCYQAKQNAEAMIFFLPGYGDYSKEYGYFFEKMATQHNITTYTIDRRGFGESQGLRSDIVDWNLGIQDYCQFIDACSGLRGHHPNTPKFLLSHSIGSLYALILCQKRPTFFNASICINPLLSFKSKPNMFQEVSLKAQAMIQVKERQPYSKMDAFLPEEIARLRHDGLDIFVEPKMTVESYLEIRKMQNEVKEDVNQIGCSQLFILGEGDSQMDAVETKSILELMEGAPSKDVVELEGSEYDHYMHCWDMTWQRVENEAIKYILSSMQKRYES